MSELTKSRLYIYSLALLAMLFWGLSFVWTAVLLKYYDPFTILFIRLSLSSLLLLGWLKLTKKLKMIRKEDAGLFFLSSLFNPFLYFIGENFGILYTSPTISAVIIATIPVFTPLAAYYALRERLSAFNYAGLLLSFIGILVMLIKPDLSFTASPLGIFLLMSAVASAIAYSVYLKKLATRYSAIMIIAVQNFLGAIYFLPFFLIFGLGTFVSVTMNLQIISSMLALAVFASSLAFIFFTISTREIGITRTNVFTNTIPVFTAVFSYFVMDEYFDIGKIIGMMIVILGVALSQIGIQKQITLVQRIQRIFEKK